MVASVLALVIWIAQFSQSPHFGLYEDDWAFIGQPMVWTWGKVVEWITMCFRSWPQGRPIGFASVVAAAFLGNRIGGLEVIYFIAFVLHAVNAFLVFTIARRYVSAAPALCAALGFAFLPSDTSVPLLTNGLFLGLTMLFMLSAILLYLRGWRVLAYFVVACSLLTYESVFMPFFAAPLLVKERDARLNRQLLKHCATLLAIGASVFWFRAHMGEERSATLLANGLLDAVQKVATALWVGPITTLRLSLTRPVAFFELGIHDGLLIMMVLVTVLTAALYFWKVETSDTLEIWPLSVKTGQYSLRTTLRVDQATAAALRLGICGAAMFVIAYVFAISRDHYPPTVEAGRLSGGTHTAAAAGMGFLWGAATAILLDLAVTHRKKFLVVLFVAGYFAGLGAFHYRVQNDFVSSWRFQQAFWRSVVKECPDLSDGDVLLFEDYSHPLRYVETNSWADPYVLTELYKFPPDWKQPPRLYPVVSSWRSDIIQTNGQLILSQPFGAWPDRVLKHREVILLKADGNGVRRIVGTITINSRELELKPLGPAASYEPNSLYRYAILRE